MSAPPLTKAEIAKALLMFPSLSAPGPDGIPYLTWKRVNTINPSSSISKNNILRSVRSVHLTHLTLEPKSRTRTQPPYHTTHLTQPDAAPDPQDAPDAAPDPQDAPDAASNTQDGT